jgi:hypothetical protein
VGNFGLIVDNALKPMTILNHIFTEPPKVGSLYIVSHLVVSGVSELSFSCFDTCSSASESRTAKEKRAEGKRKELGRDEISTLEQRPCLFSFNS